MLFLLTLLHYGMATPMAKGCTGIYCAYDLSHGETCWPNGVGDCKVIIVDVIAVGVHAIYQ